MKKNHRIGNKFAVTHGDSYTRFFSVWHTMRVRCLNKNSANYKNYGGRGIKICKRWMKYKNFKEDMFKTYKEGLKLDRINNNGHYSKTNCRWATDWEQSQNRRNTYFVIFNNSKKSLSEWCKILDRNLPRARERIKRDGWSIYDALIKPTKIPYKT